MERLPGERTFPVMTGHPDEWIRCPVADSFGQLRVAELDWCREDSLSELVRVCWHQRLGRIRGQEDGKLEYRSRDLPQQPVGDRGTGHQGSQEAAEEDRDGPSGVAR